MKVHTCNPRTPGRDKVILGYTASLEKERRKGEEGRKEGRNGGRGREGKGTGKGKRRKKTEQFIFYIQRGKLYLASFHIQTPRKPDWTSAVFSSMTLSS